MFLNIFSVTFFLIFIIGILSKRIKGGKNFFCIISGVSYFLIAAIRSWKVGGDSYNYVKAFEYLADKNLHMAITYSDKDPIFYGFLSLLGRWTNNYTVLFVIVSAFFSISIWFFIYRYSKDPLLSIIILLSMNLYQFSLTGMRQTIAISFTVWAIVAMDKGKIKTAILLILFGSFFHASVLVFLIIVVMRKIKVGYRFLYLSIPTLIVCFVFRAEIANQLIGLVSERGYEVDITKTGLTMMFVIFVLYVMAVVFARDYVGNSQTLYMQYGIAMMAVFFEILVSTQNIFFRIAFYFLIIYIVLIPNVLMSIKNRKIRIIFRFAIYVLLTIQYLMFTIGSSYILPYTTFWQV